MDSFIWEMKKLYSDKSVLAFMFMLILINIGVSFLTYSQSEEGRINYSPAEYKKMYNTLKDMPDEDARQKIVDIIENTDDKCTDADMPWHLLMSDLNCEYSHVCTYQNSIEYYIEALKQEVTVGVGTITGVSSKRNLDKMLCDLTELRDVVVKAGPVKGLMCYFDSVVSDFLYIILSVFLLYKLIIVERIRGDINLYISTVNGHRHLAVAKYAAASISIIIIILITQCCDILLLKDMYGLGDLKRSVQSLPRFEICQFGINIYEAIAINIVVKMMLNIMIVGILYVVFTKFKSLISIYGSVILFLGLSVGLYMLINENSRLDFLKNINVFAFMQGGRLIGEYRNINVFGIPCNYLITSIVIIVFITALVIMIIMDLFDKPIFGIDNSFIICTPTFKLYSLFVHEVTKCLFDGKVWIIILVLAAFIIKEFRPVADTFYLPDTFYEDVYLDEFKGEVTDDKINAIDERIQTIEKKMEQNVYDDNIVQSYNALMYIRGVKTEYLKQVGGDYLVDTGYRILTGDKKLIRMYDSKKAIILVLFLAYPLAFLFGYDRQYNMDIIENITLNGVKKKNKFQLIIAIAFSTVIYITVYFPLYYEVFKEYGFDSILSPACSMDNLKQVPVFINILEYLVLIVAARYIGVLLLVIFSKLLAKRFRGIFQILLCELGVVLLPLVLVYIGVPGTQFLLLNPLFIGNV